MKSIAFLTYAKFPEPTLDDCLAIEALKAHQIQVSAAIWDETPVNALSQFDLVVVRSIWDYHEKSELFGNWLDEVVRQRIQLMNPPKLLAWNSTKRYLRELERNHAIPIVPTLWMNRSQPNILSQLKELDWSEIVLKPEISASADLTFRLKREDIEDHASSIQKILERCDLLVQPYCPSVIDGEYSLVYFGNSGGYQYSHAVRKTPKTGDFRVQEEWGGSFLPFDASEEFRQVADRTVALIPNPWLYARIDLILYNGTPHVAELELIEPHLYFGTDANAAARFAESLTSFL